jgi:hypothetical protein
MERPFHADSATVNWRLVGVALALRRMTALNYIS